MEKELFKEIKQIFIKYKWKFSFAFSMLVLSNVLLVLNPLIIREALAELTTTSPTEGIFVSILNLFNSSESLWAWTVLLLVITCVGSFLKYKMRALFIRISREVELRARSFLFNRIQMQSQVFFDRHQIGDLLSRLTNDLQSYRDLLGPGLLYPMFMLTLAIPSIWALSIISFKLTLFTLIPLVLVPIVNSFIRKPMYRFSVAVQRGLGQLSTIAQENYSAIRLVKAYNMEDTLLGLFAQKCLCFFMISIRLSCLQGSIGPFFSIFTKISTIFLVMVSALLIFHYDDELTTGDFVAFMWIQSFLFAPLLLLTWLLPIYERGRAAYGRLVEIAFEPIEVIHSDSNLTIPSKADIEITNLTFNYLNTSKPALKNLSFKIKGGSWVGITGPVGSGKSTLFRLLNRDYEIPRGMISINNIDIHDYPLEAFKEMVTIEQISFLFSRTIAENIVFAKQEAEKDEIEQVARFADIHDTILDFPQQYETIVGEKGVTLSGGQKQRVSMARAFLVDKSILLLDDIFSAVDSKTEKKIFNAIKTNYRDKTLFLITHRISILEKMDYIICLKDGEISEAGTPQELAKNEGYYSALMTLQGFHHESR